MSADTCIATLAQGPLQSLDNKYTTFGKMIKGDEVLKTLGNAKTVKGDYPFERQGIEKVTIGPAAEE